MTIEADMELISNQLRQLLLCNENILQVIQSLGGKPIITGDGSGIAIPGVVEVTVSNQSGEVVNIDVVDFGELDAMGCPYDPSIMSTTKSKNKTGARKGCWSKRKDADYTQEEFLLDCRKLIAKVQAAKEATPGNDAPTAAVEETTDELPPQTTGVAPPPPPPMTAVTENVSELPSVDAETVTTEQFVELCRVFVLKHGDDGAHCVSELMKKCGRAGQTPDDIDQQDQLSWITKRIIDHDATHA